MKCAVAVQLNQVLQMPEKSQATGMKILRAVNVEFIWTDSHVQVFMGYKPGPSRNDEVSNWRQRRHPRINRVLQRKSISPPQDSN